MPLSQHPNNPALGYGWNLGESGWHNSYNGNFRALGVILHLAVLSATTSAQPSTPSAGDRYIVPAAATGAEWSGQGGSVAAFVDGAWRFYTPSNGWRAYVVDENRDYKHIGGSWIPAPVIPPAYDNAGRPAANAVPTGSVVFNTDANRYERSDGTDWVREPVEPEQFTDSNRPDPTTVPAGREIFNTDDGAPNWSNGTDWVDATGATT